MKQRSRVLGSVLFMVMATLLLAVVGYAEDEAPISEDGSDSSEIPIVALITAIGALGTAAFSLVDASKVLRGGPSNIGFKTLEAALLPFAAALDRALGPDSQGNPAWRGVVRAHWINGRPRGEQKAIVKSLIRLGLAPRMTDPIARAGHVDAPKLAAVALKLEAGTELDEPDLNVLGRLDASIEAQLDAAFDRADQQYRNWSRVIAGIVAVGLSCFGRYAMEETFTVGLGEAVLIGLVAVPLAPVAKDLASSLQAAAAALRAAK